MLRVSRGGRAWGWVEDIVGAAIPAGFAGLISLILLVFAGVGRWEPQLIPPALAAERMRDEERVAEQLGFARAPAPDLAEREVTEGRDALWAPFSLRPGQCLAAIVSASGSRYPAKLWIAERGYSGEHEMELASATDLGVVQHVQMCAPRAMEVQVSVTLRASVYRERERPFDARVSLWTAERAELRGALNRGWLLRDIELNPG